MSETPPTAIEIVMPRMGLTMETGTVVKWLKQEGDLVKSGDLLLEIETDKSVVEIEALDTGILSHIIAQPGETLPVGGLLAYLLPPESANAAQPDNPPREDSRPQKTTSTPPVLPSAHPINHPESRVKASPAARRLARRLEVDLHQVKGSGPGGRVVARNVQLIPPAAPQIQTPESPSQTPVPPKRISPLAQKLAQELGVDIQTVSPTGIGGTVTRQDVERAAQLLEKQQAIPSAQPQEGDSLRPFSTVQRKIAERMVQSFYTAPHFYLQVEADARQMVALRNQLLPAFEQRFGVHITYTDFLIYFCSRLLPRHPLLMAQWTSEGLLYRSSVNIGIAVDTEQGLFVPVLHDADKLGLAEIARKRQEITGKARQGKLLPQDYEKGIFTLTNLGTLRIDAFNAIINPPQAAILAVGQIKERPMIQAHQVIAAETVNLSLSVDHRVLDGAKAARFLSELVEWIETPALSMA